MKTTSITDRSEAKAIRIRTLRECIDNDGYLCSFAGNDGYRVGYVCGMTANDWATSPEYAPTRLELKELAYHWFVQYFDVHFYMFQSGVSGSTENHIASYSASRLKILREQLGESDFQAIQADVEMAFLDRFGQSWKRFTNYPKGAHRE